MKSVFSMVFAYGALLLASVAAHATDDHLTQVGALGHADLCHISLDVVAAADEEQADSSDADTMLA